MATMHTETTVDNSHSMTRRRYAKPEAAARYPSTYGNRGRHQRERNTILKTFHYIPADARVLDLPCGTARCTRLLAEHGFRVTGADNSEFMVELAGKNYRRWQQESSSMPNVDFQLRDALDTGYEADQFEAIFCNRLLHHFREPEIRRAALTEFRRICTGPVIVSFFNSFSLDTLTWRVSHLLRRKTPVDRIPISMRTFAADIDAAGLRIEAKLANWWGISRQWYVVLRRA